MMSTLSQTVQERISLPGQPRRDEERGSTITPGDVWQMLRRRVVLIVVSLILLSSAAVGGFVLWWQQFPGYRSECWIECISNIPESEMSTRQERPRQEEHERFVLSQAMRLKSPSILGQTLTLNAVRQTDWYESVPEGEQLLELTDDLTAAPLRGTNYLRVSMECRNKTDARIIVGNVVSQWYETVKREAAELFTAEGLEASRDDKNALETTITEKRARLRQIAANLGPGSQSVSGQNLTLQQALIEARQVAVNRKELALLQKYQEIYNDPSGLAITPADRAVIEQDPQIAQLTANLFLLEQQRASDLTRLGSQHRVIKNIDADISAIHLKLDGLRMSKTREVVANGRERTNTAADSTREAMTVEMESFARSEALLEDQDRVRLDYTILEAEIEQSQEELDKVNEYINNLTRVVKQQSAVKVSIAQPATEPLERSSPSVILLPVGLFLAVALSLGLALAVELLDKSVRTSQDIVRYLEVAMLGAVPDIDDEEVHIDDVKTAVLDAPRSMIAEAFRRIRTNLQFSAPADQQRTLLIASPSPNDGKTTVACNLAMAIAQGGRRVLLVDGNFRRPTLSSVFKKAKGPGLSNLLVGEGTLDSYVVKTPLAKLDLLGSGPIPPNPGELLGSDHCRTFLEKAKSRYDQIVIDTSPLLLTSDALVLSPEVDGVILVVRANRNSRGLARRACGLLSDVKAHMFGAVLNAAQVTRGGYYREQLRAYYDYQSDAESAQLPEPSDPSGDSGGKATS